MVWQGPPRLPGHVRQYRHNEYERWLSRSSMRSINGSTGWKARASKPVRTTTSTAEAYSSGWKSEWTMTDVNFLFGRLDWRKDRFSGYEKQFSQTVGYGHRLIDNEKHSLNGELGVGARQSDLAGGGSTSETILTGGFITSGRLVKHQISPRTCWSRPVTKIPSSSPRPLSRRPWSETSLWWLLTPSKVTPMYRLARRRRIHLRLCRSSMGSEARQG